MVLQDNEAAGYNANGTQPESDAKKLADKHLADPNHVITDEEMASIRIGTVSEADAPTRQAVRESEERIADQKSDSENDSVPGSQKSTPWDVLGE